MKLTIRSLLLTLSATLAAAHATSSATQSDQNYTLQVHPLFSPAQAEMVYQPLIDYLNAATEYRFDLATARDFHRYWQDARRGQQPDLVLEDAHMIAFRMSRHGFVPLVRAEEFATFSLLSDDFDLEELDDFVGQPISSMPAPSLGHLVLIGWFTNPLQQPVINSGAVSWQDAVNMVFSGESMAAVAPHTVVREYFTLSQVSTSIEFPHITIAASPDLPESVRFAVETALLELDENLEFFEVLNELEIARFVRASDDEYVGLDEWLRYVYFDF